MIQVSFNNISVCFFSSFSSSITCSLLLIKHKLHINKPLFFHTHILHLSSLSLPSLSLPSLSSIRSLSSILCFQEYREFDETIVPKVVAEALMSVRSQIAAEMKLDIMMLPGESEKTLASYKLKEDRKGQWQGEGSNMFKMVGNGEWESTAFRFLNYDLLRKLSVR
jgi:hypothetical protein